MGEVSRLDRLIQQRAPKKLGSRCLTTPQQQAAYYPQQSSWAALLGARSNGCARVLR